MRELDKLVSSTVVLFLFLLHVWWGNSQEALGDEFVLLLASLASLNLLQHLSTGDALLSTSLEFAHVVPVSLDLLFLGIDTASIKGGPSGSNAKEGRSGSKSLES